MPSAGEPEPLPLEASAETAECGEGALCDWRSVCGPACLTRGTALPRSSVVFYAMDQKLPRVVFKLPDPGTVGFQKLRVHCFNVRVSNPQIIPSFPFKAPFRGSKL